MRLKKGAEGVTTNEKGGGTENTLRNGNTLRALG